MCVLSGGSLFLLSAVLSGAFGVKRRGGDVTTQRFIEDDGLYAVKHLHDLMQPQMHIQKLFHRCCANLFLERICVQIKLPHLGERVSGCRGADLPSERFAEIFVHEPAFRAGKVIDAHQARPDALFAPVRNAEHVVPAL